MDIKFRFKSITTRWLLNVYLIIVAAVTAIAVIVSMLFASLIFSSVQSQAADYAQDFDSLSSANRENFYDLAIEASEGFEHKDKIEVQVINSGGKVIVSTTGFQSPDNVTADFNRAVGSGSGSYVFRGKNSGGERVMAGTKLIYGSHGEVLGAYRWISSLKSAYRKINITVIIIVLLYLSVLGLCAVSGFFFMKSIVNHLREMGNTARKIAGGDFKARIEVIEHDEIGELSETINYMASELENAETMKNDFISSVSHELRTPLTAIRGWGETAKMSIGTDEELVARGLDVVLSEADRLSGLVEELLDFSRMQSGRISVNIMPMDVSELLRAATDMYTELAVKQGIELSYTPPMQNSIVLGDPDRLKQVFINIIDNAVKYTEKGGLVLVTQTREDGCVRITVKDTGVGIPAEDLDHVKEKFFKSNKTVRGSGIGLAVADEIIKQHQGLLFIESTEGVGTTATIVLPLYEEPEEVATPAEEVIEPLETVQEELPITESEENIN
ncbi:MAG: HAMP domain-containing sensor histidine kinase [Acutalibacteraceae bacterium]|nr:HAMP domain-containing sensor histidine kinase [Acutalibacteraceae bacterium]